MVALLKSRLFMRQFIPIFIILAALLALYTGGLMVRAHAGIMAREYAIAGAYSDAVLASLNRWIDARVDDVSKVALEVEALAAEGATQKAYSRRFAAMVGTGSLYTDFFLTDASGLVVASRAESISRTVDLSDRDYIREALSGRSFVSGIFEGRINGSLIFAISMPVHTGREHGALAGVVSLKNLVGIVDTLNFSAMGRALLLSTDGRILAEPGAAADAPYAAAALDRFLKGRSGSALYTNHRGETVVGAWGTIERLGLVLLVELDNDQALAPLRDLLSFAGLISAAAFLAMLFVVYSFSKGLVKPIRALVELAQNIKTDEYRSVLAMNTGTELDELIGAFNDMAKTVREREAGLKDSASRDSLTGLFNHGKIEEYLELEMRRKRRAGLPVCFVMIDIDHFKDINDTYGHQAGDDALRALAALMRGLVREADVVGRYGGEEFAIILDAKDCAETALFCERMRAAVEAKAFECDGRQLRFTVSLGFACAAPDSMDHFELIRHADRSLYEAKNAGRNTVRSGC
jgi:diguanylate cyclase (GGDEF)-like protein